MRLKKKTKRTLKLTAKITISFAALYFVYTKIDIKEISNLLKNANIFYLILALIFFIISKIFSAFRLNYHLRNENINISHKDNLKLYLLGMFYNIFLPGGIGGDGYKIYLICKRFRIKPALVFKTLIIDRSSGTLALFSLLFILFYFLPVLLIYKIAVLLLIPTAYLTYSFLIKKYFNKHLKSLNKNLILSFFVQLSQIVTSIFILLSINTFSNLSAYLFIFLISSVLAAIPITFGGIGVRELTFIYGAKFISMEPTTAITLSLVFYLITLSISLSGMYYGFKSNIIKKLPA